MAYLIAGFLAWTFLMLLGRELLASWEPKSFGAGVLALVVVPVVLVLGAVAALVLGL